MNAPLRIVVFGTESTGKTTLTQRLAEHFGEPWAPEFVRSFWDEHGGSITAADLDAIARGQIANEDAAAARARRVVFFDTDLLTCTIWNDVLFPGECPAWVRREADRRAAEIACYLLCDTDVPFTPDPQRCFPEPAARDRARQIWRDALTPRRLPFVEVRGDWATRERTAIAAVEKILASAAGM
jgi:HTH-type transcriptional regulator, transcriptional repressor of NAD biosynthesis genes